MKQIKKKKKLDDKQNEKKKEEDLTLPKTNEIYDMIQNKTHAFDG